MIPIVLSDYSFFLSHTFADILTSSTRRLLTNLRYAAQQDNLNILEEQIVKCSEHTLLTRCKIYSILFSPTSYGVLLALAINIVCGQIQILPDRK